MIDDIIAYLRQYKFQGDIYKNFPLGQHTWFRTHGLADLMVKPTCYDDIYIMLQAINDDVPLHYMGAGSNSLVRDGGVRGVVAMLGKEFHYINDNDADDIMHIGARTPDNYIAQYATQKGYDNMAYLIGIPGALGGAVTMNAGCFGSETSDIVHEVSVIYRDGKSAMLTHEECNFSYRHSAIMPDMLVTDIYVKKNIGDKVTTERNMTMIKDKKAKAQPMRGRTGGSTFKNPPDHHAWQLIDEVGMRGFAIGDACFSDKHCNFIINQGHASAHDIEALALEAMQRVLVQKNIQLLWEVKVIGEPIS